MTGDGLRPTPSRSLPAADRNRSFSPSMADFFEKGQEGNLTIDQGASYLRRFDAAEESFQSDWWSGVREVYVCAINSQPCKEKIFELANDGEIPQEALIELQRVVSAFDLLGGR